MTAWHIWTDQARTVNRRELRTQKTRLQRLCREVFAQTIGGRIYILRPARRSSSWLQQIISIRLKANFATRKLCRATRKQQSDIAQAAGSPAGRPSLLDSDIATGPQAFPKARPSLLAAATTRRRLGGPYFVLATRTLMTPHCSQTKADAKGKRRRGETKAWHAQRWAPPPRRRRRQGHQRERLDQCGGWGERRVPPVA